MQRTIVKISAVLLIVIFSLAMFGCSQSYDNATYVGDEAATGDNGDSLGYNKNTELSSEKDSEGIIDDRKIIFTASLSLETIDYDKSISDFENLIDEYEGFIQESHVESSTGLNSKSKLRSAEYIVRVPSEKLDAFRAAAGDIGTILVNTKSGDDITERYIDTESRLNSLEIQEERLLALLEKAETLEDIIKLEDRLAQLRYEIEGYTGSIQKWDALVEMSTVTVSIEEVEVLSEPEPDSFWEQISAIFLRSIDALGKTLKNIVLVIVAVLPFILVFGGVALVIILVALKAGKSKRENKDK